MRCSLGSNSYPRTSLKTLRLRPITYPDYVLSAFIATLHILILVASRETRAFIYASDRFSRWFSQLSTLGLESFSADKIKEGFGFNHEHPMLAYRFPTMIFGGALVMMTQLLGVALGGRLVGLTALCLWSGCHGYFFMPTCLVLIYL